LRKIKERRPKPRSKKRAEGDKAQATNCFGEERTRMPHSKKTKKREAEALGWHRKQGRNIKKKTDDYDREKKGEGKNDRQRRGQVTAKISAERHQGKVFR